MNVRRVLAPNPGPYTGDGTNTYVLDSEGEALIIDPGPNDERHLQAILASVESLAPQMILVTHTHEDHAPAANPLAAMLSVPVAGHGPGREFKPDRILVDNDIVEFGGTTVRAVATPGHSPDHLCFLAESALFTGDHIMGGSSVFVEDMTAYMASLRKVQRLPLDVLYPGHGPAEHDPRAVIAEYIEHRLERERQIVEAVESGRTDVNAIVATVYAQVDSALLPLAAIAVHAHLRKLAVEGVVRVDGDEVTLL
jgi:glyoxylase-like metal-dependent hydrolase (beta-lactamase superfamily II)